MELGVSIHTIQFSCGFSLLRCNEQQWHHDITQTYWDYNVLDTLTFITTVQIQSCTNSKDCTNSKELCSKVHKSKAHWMRVPPLPFQPPQSCSWTFTNKRAAKGKNWQKITPPSSAYGNIMLQVEVPLFQKTSIFYSNPRLQQLNPNEDEWAAWVEYPSLAVFSAAVFPSGKLSHLWCTTFLWILTTVQNLSFQWQKTWPETEGGGREITWYLSSCREEAILKSTSECQWR